MMSNADKWDDFLALLRASAEPWPQDDRDTDEYRQGRALRWFNLFARVARGLLELKPTLRSWVPHVGLFIVPRQMLLLGDPQRRACDACESFGAMVKKSIKHGTCRRRLNRPTSNHKKKLPTGGNLLWKQTFKRGYVEQAFRRMCVRESLLHGEENMPWLQRADYRRLNMGSGQREEGA